MPEPNHKSCWNDTPGSLIPDGLREEHVLNCSSFVAAQLRRHPEWSDGIDKFQPPQAQDLATAIEVHGLNPGLRQFRNLNMLRIIWRDLCGLSPLNETFHNLTTLAELCADTAVSHHTALLQAKHGRPMGKDGSGEQRLTVIGMGKLGGGELNLSSDIDVIFCYPQGGECDGRRGLSNEQFFTRLARAVISSLSDITEDGFCFRVDTRLRPFGDAGPLCSSIAALEQYYQREGRDWERYALVKARPIAGDLLAGKALMDVLRPFVYRRYIDFGAVEALQQMHTSVQEDARRKERLDDVKRGPGGIREIEFLAQCFQLLRGGREPGLQTASLETALEEIRSLGLLEAETVKEIHRDYVYLRTLENRIQAMRDQQTHRLPQGDDLNRLVAAMGTADEFELVSQLKATRERVARRFAAIFPERSKQAGDERWGEAWRELQAEHEDADDDSRRDDPLSVFLRRLQRMSLSRRAHRRLDDFMPLLLRRFAQEHPPARAQNRIFDLVLAICRRSAYLVLLVQHPEALDRMLELFSRSEWIADRVTRFPALLDELIDPSLGLQIPDRNGFRHSVDRMLQAAQGAEAVLEGLNYLKLATGLRIAVAQLQQSMDSESARSALSGLAEAILHGVLNLATGEIEIRHGRLAAEGGDGQLAVIAYGTLGALELGYDSDLDIIFLFEAVTGQSDGKRPLPAERYYARMAQRILSFLTVTTPSGRLYEVDTRLRPNGRAGSLVSTTEAFRRYQLEQAWTWELQALTRARFVAGGARAGSAFEAIRKEVLSQPREPDQLKADLAEMRCKIESDGAGGQGGNADASPKYQPGGLIDIEFIVQLGVLACGGRFRDLLDETGSLGQLAVLAENDWIGRRDAEILNDTALKLRRRRLLRTLVPDESGGEIDTRAAARVYQRIFGVRAEPS
jgi:glutamate-ammonia-ligase adenylyltransferase